MPNAKALLHIIVICVSHIIQGYSIDTGQSFNYLCVTAATLQNVTL